MSLMYACIRFLSRSAIIAGVFSRTEGQKLVALPWVLVLSALTVACGDDPAREVVPPVAEHADPIVGGKDAPEGAYPWIVSLRYPGDKHGCGGSLLTPTWVLTAAHCPMPNSVVIGGLDVTAPNDGFRRNTRRRILHPNYDVNTLDYDFALLELFLPVPVRGVLLNRNSVFPAAQAYSDASIRNSVTAGWGYLTPGKRIRPAILQHVGLPVISNIECGNIPGALPVTARMMCAGIPRNDISGCKGDSGGPLIGASVFGFAVLVGVTSWGGVCTPAKNPTVWARVSAVSDWITASTGPLPSAEGADSAVMVAFL